VTEGVIMRCTWTASGQTITFRVASTRLPYGGYDDSTSAALTADGTLTEQRVFTNALAIYPRVYRR
jgi:hypothetical protein